MVKKEVIDVVNRYIAVLKENRIVFSRVIIFGSAVIGSSDSWSDIDLAVISPDFGRDVFNERMILAKMAYHIDPRLEVHPIGEFDFENESWKTIIHQIKTTGIEIAA